MKDKYQIEYRLTELTDHLYALLSRIDEVKIESFAYQDMRTDIQETKAQIKLLKWTLKT